MLWGFFALRHTRLVAVTSPEPPSFTPMLGPP
jgi:hypothetical protein